MPKQNARRPSIGTGSRAAKRVASAPSVVPGTTARRSPPAVDCSATPPAPRGGSARAAGCVRGTTGHAVLGFQLAQVVEDRRPLFEHLGTVTLFELGPTEAGVVVGVEERAAWRSILEPQVDAVFAHPGRPLAHDQHAPTLGGPRSRA